MEQNDAPFVAFYDSVFPERLGIVGPCTESIDNQFASIPGTSKIQNIFTEIKKNQEVKLQNKKILI